MSHAKTDETHEKRHARPWIASFDIQDTTCKNASTYDDLTHLSDGTCVSFQNDYFAGSIAGGSWADLDIIEGFIDDSCTMTEYPATITRKGKEDGFCTPMGEMGTWRGVMGHASSADTSNLDESFTPNPDVVW